MTDAELAALALIVQPGLKVLYTTGFAEVVTGAGKLTFSGWLLAKPYRKMALAVAVREVMDQ